MGVTDRGNGQAEAGFRSSGGGEAAENSHGSARWAKRKSEKNGADSLKS
jgi:hypothetical protein